MTLSCPRGCLGVTVSVGPGNPQMGPGVNRGTDEAGGTQLDHEQGQAPEQLQTQGSEGYRPTSNSRKTAYPELTGEVAMVGAPLDTTRADRGGAAAPGDRAGVLRRFLGSAGRPKSVNDTAADHSHAA